MRVLFINRMLQIERGGGETFDLEISRNLERQAVEVSYLCGLPLSGGPRVPLVHPRAHAVRTPTFTWFPWDKVKGGWRLRVAEFAMFERAAIRWAAARQHEFDIIQVCELPGFVSGWKKAGHKTPVVIRLTAPNYYDPSGGVPAADAIIASGSSLEQLRARGLSRAVNVPNCVDGEHFRPGPSGVRAKHGIPADAFVVVYVARFQAFKNHRMLVDAFARVALDLPQAHLVLAGSGPLQPDVRAQVTRLGLHERVTFLGEVPFADLPAVYAASDLMAVSSDYESFCFAALEAMATALPLVTTDCAWVPNLIRPQNGGLVVPVADAGAFAKAVLQLARDPTERARMGQANRAHVLETYSWPASAAKLLAVYNGLPGVGASR